MPRLSSGRRTPRRLHDAVVEAVHRVAARRGTPVQHLEQLLVMDLGQALDLDVDLPVPDQLQDFREQRQRLPVSDPHLSSLVAGQPRERPEPGNLGVVMDHDGAVTSGMDVELDTVGVQHHRPAEGGTRVLVLVTGRTAVSDDVWASHWPKIAALNKRRHVTSVSPG